MTFLKKEYPATMIFVLAALSLSGMDVRAGSAGHPFSLRPANSGTHDSSVPEALYHGPLKVLKKYRMASAVECRSNSDCPSGEVCCVVSGLETYCATRDECYGKPMKDDDKKD